GELIAVYGDFDVDGVTASAILSEGLAALGASILTYIPDRFSEGYGVNTEAIDRLHARGVGLILSADCGTSSIPEVAHARKLGIDAIVIDHHTVPAELPDTIALINPKRPGNRYPEPELASGGLAFKLMSALYARMGRPFDPDRYLDLVALSTICDVAPLRDENRSLVQRGLQALAQTSRPGLRALLDASGVDPSRIDADTIGYALGPRLHAAGRLAHAQLALDLLTETGEDNARERALQLTELNQQRQQATAEAMALARDLLADEDPDAPLIFIGHPDIPSGIVGIVAGRLAEEFYRPAVVYERGEAESRASCRSIPEFDIAAALRTAPDLMLRFGGHRAAAGFTATNDNLPVLKAALQAHTREALAGLDLAPVLDIDAAVPLRSLNGRLIHGIFRMAPFGEANPEPTFLSRDVEVADVRLLGEDGAHLRLRLRDGRVTWPAIAFHLNGNGRTNGANAPTTAGNETLAEHAAIVAPGDRIDVVYTFSQDRASTGARLGGDSGALELRVKDLAPAAPTPVSS
ncbi:MAG TPA: single-stranded-DNA-specific exonuclease RecJ, partial [Dehalococcoidia bacterium]|nr:single-stranded-DNA-specific exonuclease RecJ [Dehalococcoidia bacterium]